jgi:O-antigen ligase
MNNKPMKTMAPALRWTGVLVFLFPFLSLVTLFGVSLCSFLFLLAALLYYKPGRAELVRHWPAVRGVVLAFLYYFAFAAFCFVSRPESPLSNVEKPARMFLAVSGLMLVLYQRPSRKALWWGAIAGAVVALVLVSYQRLLLGVERPGGLINPITFGDLSLCIALVSLAATIDFRHSTREALWPALGVVAGLVASVLTGTRGGWVALVPAGLLFLRQARLMHSWRLRALLLSSFALMLSTYFIPASGVQARVDLGVDEVRMWLDGSAKLDNSSVGTRLELWKGATMLIAEHPLLGLDPATYKEQLQRYVLEGRLDRVVLPMPHLHNDALQAFVTGGVFGFAAWLGILVAPFVFFARVMASGTSMDAPQFTPALAGILVVLSYFSFGLTEVIFWSVKGSLFYALMVFMLMGFCLNAKESGGN